METKLTKDQFIDKRTEIISKMLDNPSKYGIYPTSICFAELDDLFDVMSNEKQIPSFAQNYRDAKNEI